MKQLRNEKFAWYAYKMSKDRSHVALLTAPASMILVGQAIQACPCLFGIITWPAGASVDASPCQEKFTLKEVAMT